ncbi:hypothetical protein NDU88_004473 [Pleurodeles waltl]|uniref:Uncharacterized protein n=1 Tax=Pleurodeles waltl TaxID=8319 RepID=A0AAV7MTK2_PLEWA|nr:hypothetical protein NDU88_004473 [Pleurodeles waltl]
MSKEHSPSPPPRCILPRRVYGERVGSSKAPRERGKGVSAQKGVQCRGNVLPGTPDLFWQRERSVGVQPGEPGAAQLPWREEQAEPSTASRCTSTVGRRKKEWAADAPEVWCGGAGFAPGGAAILGEQHPGPSSVQHGKDRRQRGEEPRGAWLPQDTGVGFQGLQAEEWELDFEEESLEEGVS